MIGDRIKALRSEKKITQEALAKHLFISPQAISRWEQGLAVPDTGILVPLADFFGVSVDFLLRDPIKQPHSDYSEAFEVRHEFKRGFLISHFKNVSTYTFERVEFKIRFLDEHGSVIDYKSDWFYDSEPETTKIVRTVTFQNPKVKQAVITITECRIK